jgi:hypothetical protein
VIAVREELRSMMEQKSFRQQLDDVLRTLDVERVRRFLIDHGQWSEEVPEDAERAMWMMIAGSATLGKLHERAREWLMGHGYEGEAEAILGRGKRQGERLQGGKKSQGQGERKDRPMQREGMVGQQKKKVQAPWPGDMEKGKQGQYRKKGQQGRRDEKGE